LNIRSNDIIYVDKSNKIISNIKQFLHLYNYDDKDVALLLSDFTNERYNQNLLPTVGNEIRSCVIYKNSRTLIKPTVHIIKFDEKMFYYIGCNRVIEQHIFSPQQDIYNATMIGPNHVWVYNDPFCEFIAPSSNTYPGNNISINLTSRINCMKSINFEIISDSRTVNLNHVFPRSEFSKISTNSIYKFVESLLQDSIRNMFSGSNLSQFNNFGFDTGTSLDDYRPTTNLSGGYMIPTSISHQLVNIENPIQSTINEYEILSSLYGSESDKHSGNAKTMFNYIFGISSKILGGDNKVDNMFTLILNYFHKYNISFNSMFNQLCYPSILFNSSVLRLSISRLCSVISSLNLKNSRDNKPNSYKSSTFETARLYLSNYVNKYNNKLVLDQCDNYRYQIDFEGKSRNQYMTLLDVINTMRNETSGNLPKFNENSILWLSNQYECPSVSNNFMSEFVKYITIKRVDSKDEKIKQIQMLFPSGVTEALRHVDSLTTLASVIFMLLKQTSYYDHEYDHDMSFFNVSNPEPFSVT